MVGGWQCGSGGVVGGDGVAYCGVGGGGCGVCECRRWWMRG